MTGQHSHGLRQAHALLKARNRGAAISWREALPDDKAQAYKIQDAVIAHLGAIGGWKVGAKGPTLEPICAPIPAEGIFPSDVQLPSTLWPLRGIEVELAFRLGQDLTPSDIGSSLPHIWAAFDAMFVAIEVVETRLSDWPHAPTLAQLADLQSHGALVLGAPQPMPKNGMDLMTLEAQLDLDGKVLTSTIGNNPAQDVQRLLLWLAEHCYSRGLPLKAGQIITTGSCTGMFFAPLIGRVSGTLNGLGQVAVGFVAPSGGNGRRGEGAFSRS